MSHTPLPLEARFTLLRRRLVGRTTRQSQRHRFTLATSGKLHFPSSGRSVYAWVSDLSASGVGLTLPVPLDEGTELVLHLRSARGKSVHQWAARVVRATREGDDAWHIGLAFCKKLAPDVLDSLLV